MGSIGMGEIFLLMLIALVVIGPEKFPQFAKIIIRTFRDLRTYVDDVKHEISKELRPVNQEMQRLSRMDPENFIDALAGSADEEEPAPPASQSVPPHTDDKKEPAPDPASSPEPSNNAPSSFDPYAD